MLKTIKSKFVTITILFIILGAGIPTAFLINQYQENFQQRSIIMLETTLSVIRNCIHNSMLNDEKDVQRIVDRYAGNEHIEHVRIMDDDGVVLYSSNKDEKDINIRQLAPSHTPPDEIKERKIEILRDEKIYYASEPILNAPSCQKCHGNEDVIAYLDIDTHFSKAETRFYTGSFHVIFLAIVMTGVLLAGFITFFNLFINKPLKKVITALNEVEGGNLDTNITFNSEDEFGIVGRQFNQMVKRIQSSQKEIEDLHYEQLQRADKLVTLGELAAEMAHEINNPSAVIMARADYLQMEMDEHPEFKKYSEDFEVIINQISKISKITGSILKYGKKRPKDFQETDLIAVINESLNILEPRITKKNIKIVKEIKCTDCKIFGDNIQCEQAITNILNNAIDAIVSDGKIVITLEPSGEQQCYLKISDNGTGIDEHTQQQIFSPFYTTKNAEKGTGLGLYIVKNILYNHQAEITCESELNKGSTFTIKFKMHK